MSQAILQIGPCSDLPYGSRRFDAAGGLRTLILGEALYLRSVEGSRC